jgi:4'-phosphopantetheinyl transferase
VDYKGPQVETCGLFSFAGSTRRDLCPATTSFGVRVPPPLELDSAEVQLWYVPLRGLNDAARRDCFALLDDEEHRRHQRFLSKVAADQFLVGHAALRQCLSLYVAVAPADWRFVLNEYGKPSLADGQGLEWLSFNVSHTRGMVVCAVGRDGDLGVDVETLDQQCDIKLAQRFFTRNEAQAIEQGPEDVRQELFLKTWTLKESVVKALGTGLSCPLSAFDVRIGETTAGVSFAAPLTENERNWRLFDVRIESRFQVAVAMRRAGGPPDRLTIHPLPVPSEQKHCPSPPMQGGGPRG